MVKADSNYLNGYHSDETKVKGNVYGWAKSEKFVRCKPNSKGRWPANLILSDDEEVRACFPVTKSGKLKSDCYKKDRENNSIFGGGGNFEHDGYEPNEGSASRFFQCCPITDEDREARRVIYQAKASSSERNAGCEDASFEKEVGHNRFDTCEKCGGYILQNQDRPSACKCDEPVRKHNKLKGNFHPCVKSLALTTYLARLISPPPLPVPRRLLNPFAGSGSEAIGAMLSNGWDEIIAIEQDAEYCRIAEARVKHWKNKHESKPVAKRERKPIVKQEQKSEGQIQLEINLGE
jgi:hypothetical protein